MIFFISELTVFKIRLGKRECMYSENNTIHALILKKDIRTNTLPQTETGGAVPNLF